MNVLHVITGLGTGGAEAMLYKLVSIEENSGTQTVVSLTQGGKHKSLLEQQGVKVYELNLKQFWMLPFRILTLLKLIRNENIQVINAWMYHAALFASVVFGISRQPGLKLFWNIRHSLQALEQEKSSLRIIIRALAILARLPCKIIFNSRKSAGEHAKYWNMHDKVQFIPNGFELEKWHPNPEGSENKLSKLLGIHNGVLVGHVGRVHPMKNHQGLINAFRKATLHGSNVHLILMGKGTEALLSTNEIDSARIHSLGECSNVHEIVPELDCFVLCSNWGEGFPNVLGEAMACELPCMTTDVGDSAFLLGDSNWVVSPYDENALSQKLKEMLVLTLDERKAIGKVNRNRIENHFTLHAVQKIYNQLYRSDSILDLSNKTNKETES